MTAERLPYTVPFWEGVHAAHAAARKARAMRETGRCCNAEDGPCEFHERAAEGRGDDA